MMRTKNKNFSILYMLLAVCLALMLAPLPAFAATVDYSTGTNEYVVGNPANPGGAIGIGGIDTIPEDNSNASGNIVNITGGTVNDGIYGGYHEATTLNSNAAAKDNQVNISTLDGSSTPEVYGGYAATNRTATGSADASGNNVSVGRGTFYQISGGLAYTADGSASASNNTVNLTGVSVDYLYGGDALVGFLLSTAANTSNSNAVIATDSSVEMDIYGGMAGSAESQTQSFVHNDNLVTLAGTTDVSGNVYGGAPDYLFAESVPDYNNGTGNTLIIKSPKSGGITVGGDVQYFQSYNFDLTGVAAGETMLELGGTAYIQDAAVTLAFDGTAPALAVNDEITLISGAAIDGEFAAKSVAVSGYTFALSLNGSALTAKLTAVPDSSDKTSDDSSDKTGDESDDKTADGSSGCDAGAGMAGMMVLISALWNPLKTLKTLKTRKVKR